MNTARVTKDLHVHKPVTRMIMCYTNESGERIAKLLDMRHETTSRFIFRTLRWASNHGVEVTFRPA